MEQDAKIIRVPEVGPWAPGYYSLFLKTQPEFALSLIMCRVTECWLKVSISIRRPTIARLR